MGPARTKILVGVIKACLKENEEFILLVHEDSSDEIMTITPQQIGPGDIAHILDKVSKSMKMGDNPEKN